MLQVYTEWKMWVQMLKHSNGPVRDTAESPKNIKFDLVDYWKTQGTKLPALSEVSDEGFLE